jgi:hypothetical protein
MAEIYAYTKFESYRVIRFDEQLPLGAVYVIAHGEDKQVRRLVENMAVLAKNNETLLVPIDPLSDEGASRELDKFREWVSSCI